jgi:phage repressor protein C with HTH and peptisase S24 domain/DNA-binding XRE family transcriptional regulator
MLHLSHNLRLIRTLSGKTQTDFGKMFEATKAMVISYEKGKAMPSDLFISRVAKYAHIDEKLLKNALLLEEDVEVEKEEKEERGTFIDKRRADKQKSEPFLVPFVPVKAQAGYVRAVDQELYLDTLEKYALPPGIPGAGHGAIWRYWEVEGDSMLPTFREGDIILTSFVHPMDWENIRNFYTYVIVTHEQANEKFRNRVLFKRIYCKNALEWVLISDNEETNPQHLLPVEYIKEVWVYRRTWSTRAEPPKQFEIKV